MSHPIAINPETDQASWRLTGKHVLAIMVGFFGIIITTSIIFTTLAVQSFRGEDVKQSYRQGLNYNATLSERAEQNALGWTASVNVTGQTEAQRLVVKVTDRDAATLYAMDFSGRLRHPADATLDRALSFTTLPNGTARADISGAMGLWTLEVDATSGDETLHFKRDLNLE